MTSPSAVLHCGKPWLYQKAGRDPGAHRLRDTAHCFLIAHMNLACLVQRFLPPLVLIGGRWPMSPLISTRSPMDSSPLDKFTDVLRQAMVVTSLSQSQSGNTSC